MHCFVVIAIFPAGLLVGGGTQPAGLSQAPCVCLAVLSGVGDLKSVCLSFQILFY